MNNTQRQTKEKRNEKAREEKMEKLRQRTKRRQELKEEWKALPLTTVLGLIQAAGTHFSSNIDKLKAAELMFYDIELRNFFN